MIHEMFIENGLIVGNEVSFILDSTDLDFDGEPDIEDHRPAGNFVPATAENYSAALTLRIRRHPHYPGGYSYTVSPKQIRVSEPQVNSYDGRPADLVAIHRVEARIRDTVSSDLLRVWEVR